MKLGQRTAAAALGVGIIAVAGAGVADASSGNPLLLGQSNKASDTTTIKSHATPLDLKGPASKPPLSVSSVTEVPHLNSQYVDGQTAAQIAAAGGKVVQVDSQFTDFVGIATCPAKTHVIGGGILPDVTAADDPSFVVATFPHITGNAFDGWEAVASDFDGTYAGAGFAFAYCSTSTVGELTGSTAIARQEQALAKQEGQNAERAHLKAIH
jgi:hypothetical protein